MQIPRAKDAVVSVDLIRAWNRSDRRLDGWTQETARRAAIRYERFLKLVAAHPGIPHAPPADIDEMWHLHMLSPVAYANDCVRLLGYILDHDGGFGTEAHELPVLQRTFEQTAERWEAMYGEPYMPQDTPADATKCWHDCQSRCWHACKTLALEVAA